MLDIQVVTVLFTVILTITPHADINMKSTRTAFQRYRSYTTSPQFALHAPHKLSSKQTMQLV